MPPSASRARKPCSHNKTQQKAAKPFSQKAKNFLKGLVTSAKFMFYALAFIFFIITLNVLFWSLHNWTSPLNVYVFVWESLAGIGWNKLLAITFLGLALGGALSLPGTLLLKLKFDSK